MKTIRTIKMKKSHVAVLTMAIIITVCSAYSLAALNQIYYLDVEWYSMFEHSFIMSERDTVLDEWKLSQYPQNLQLKLVENMQEYNRDGLFKKLPQEAIQNLFFDHYCLLYAGFVQADSLEYRIRIIGIAQRGNILEVKTSINSPDKKNIYEPQGKPLEDVCDIIRIDRNQMSQKGLINVIFKDQYGQKIMEDRLEIH